MLSLFKSNCCYYCYGGFKDLSLSEVLLGFLFFSHIVCEKICSMVFMRLHLNLRTQKTQLCLCNCSHSRYLVLVFVFVHFCACPPHAFTHAVRHCVLLLCLSLCAGTPVIASPTPVASYHSFYAGKLQASPTIFNTLLSFLVPTCKQQCMSAVACVQVCVRVQFVCRHGPCRWAA